LVGGDGANFVGKFISLEFRLIFPTKMKLLAFRHYWVKFYGKREGGRPSCVYYLETDA
jgi:hypothetical protein